jgi:transposase
MIEQTREKHGFKLMVVGLEQTGRLHEPVRRFLQKRWEVKLIHPLVTNHLRQGVAPNIKTEGMDMEAQMRAVTGCYGLSPHRLPVAFERWRAIYRAREQLVDERSSMKLRMHERLHAVLPGFSSQFDNVWACASAVAVMEMFDTPADLLAVSEAGLLKQLREHGVRCCRRTAEKLQSWAVDVAPTSPAATTEASILHGDLDQLAFLVRRIEALEREMLTFLVQTPFVLLMSISGISHVLASAIGASAGPMQFYPTANNLSGRSGLYPRRYQSDETDRVGGMARGEPFLRDALMKSGRCVTMPTGAFFAWGESRRRNGWCEKEIVAAMANRLCRIIHAMVLKAETFRHPDAKPGVSILGKLLNVASNLGIEADTASQLARQVVARIPARARAVELHALQTGSWKSANRPREHGASPGTTRQISCKSVAVIIELLNHTENYHDIETSSEFWSP